MMKKFFFYSAIFQMTILGMNGLIKNLIKDVNLPITVQASYPSKMQVYHFSIQPILDVYSINLLNSFFFFFFFLNINVKGTRK